MLIGRRAGALWHACAASRTCGGGGDRVSFFDPSPAAAAAAVAAPASVRRVGPVPRLQLAASSLLAQRPLTSADIHIDTSEPAPRCLSISTHGFLRAERRLLRGTPGPHRAAGHCQDGENRAPDAHNTVCLRAGVWRWLLFPSRQAAESPRSPFLCPPSSLFIHSQNPLSSRTPTRTPLSLCLLDTLASGVTVISVVAALRSPGCLPGTDRILID